MSSTGIRKIILHLCYEILLYVEIMFVVQCGYGCFTST
jgi:hypothetical protein